MGEERKVYKVLVGKLEGKRSLGRQRRRWEDGIRMDLRETGLGVCGLDPTGSGQRPVAGCCECGDEPSGSCATELVSYPSLLQTFGIYSPTQIVIDFRLLTVFSSCKICPTARFAFAANNVCKENNIFSERLVTFNRGLK
jgi:hypothetical protein